MKKFLILFNILLIISQNLLSQQHNFKFPTEEIKKFNDYAYKKVCARETDLLQTKKNDNFTSGFLQLNKIYESLVLPEKYLSLEDKNITVYDTLFVADTLIVTGNWLHDGPIIIVNDGLLQFQHANATILGDIYLMGAHPKLIADSSTLYIPQQYFYQRSLIITGGGSVQYHNTTVDHSGLSHNLAATDSAYLELDNVTNIGFTTNGLYGHPVFNIKDVNVAGEYVISGDAALTFKNSKTILLWHQFPTASTINFSFPANDTVYNYHFNNTISGISGINYNIEVDSCTDVMWGMMPVTGSDVTISNSTIRAIGLWFLGADTVTVNGLVNNSTYSNFTAPLSDRNLQLNNCHVQTWSLYPMEQTYIDMTGCIVGEIGCMGSSDFSGSSFFCDGSGGYLWAGDTSLIIAGFSTTSGYVRSQVNGILLYAYSSILNGYPSALGNSVIMVIQSNVPQEPKVFDGGAAWYALIDQPFDAYTDQLVPVTGSAWIDKTPSSYLMDFRNYRLYYQISGASTWTEIPTDSLNEKRDETLGVWNTTGLAPGQYILKLVLLDNWGNNAEAIKGVNLFPSIVGITANKSLDSFIIFPNPAKDKISIVAPVDCKGLSIKITGIAGQLICEKKVDFLKAKEPYLLDIKDIPGGCYGIKLTTEDSGFCKILTILK